MELPRSKEVTVRTYGLFLFEMQISLMVYTEEELLPAAW